MSDSQQDAQGQERPDIDEMDREEMADELTSLRDDVDFLQNCFWDLEKALIGDRSLGRVATEIRNDERESVLDHFAKIENGEVGGGTVSESVRHELLPIHRMAVDLQIGEDVKDASPRRGARLFQRFIDLYLSDEARYEVNKDNGLLKMMASTAKRVLTEEDDIPETGQSTVVKRAMKQMQSLSKEEDCDCNGLENCDHGLMVWTKRKSQHTITADVDEFEAYLSRIEGAKNGSASPISDDSTGASLDEDGEADETNTDVSQSTEEDPFGELDQAEAVTDDTTDTVENSIETDVETIPASTDGGRPE